MDYDNTNSPEKNNINNDDVGGEGGAGDYNNNENGQGEKTIHMEKKRQNEGRGQHSF